MGRRVSQAIYCLQHLGVCTMKCAYSTVPGKECNIWRSQGSTGCHDPCCVARYKRVDFPCTRAGRASQCSWPSQQASSVSNFADDVQTLRALALVWLLALFRCCATGFVHREGFIWKMTTNIAGEVAQTNLSVFLIVTGARGYMTRSRKTWRNAGFRLRGDLLLHDLFTQALLRSIQHGKWSWASLMHLFTHAISIGTQWIIVAVLMNACKDASV